MAVELRTFTDAERMELRSYVQLAAEAIAHYTKAAGLAPGLFAPHYNLGLAYRESFKFAEGEAESRRASEIDAEAVAYYAGLDPARVKSPAPPVATRFSWLQPLLGCVAFHEVFAPPRRSW